MRQEAIHRQKEGDATKSTTTTAISSKQPQKDSDSDSDGSIVLPSDSDTDTTPSQTPEKGKPVTSSSSTAISSPAVKVVNRFGRSAFDSDSESEDSVKAPTMPTPASTVKHSPVARGVSGDALASVSRVAQKFGTKKFDSDDSDASEDDVPKVTAVKGKPGETRAEDEDMVMSFDDDFDDSFLDAMG